MNDWLKIVDLWPLPTFALIAGYLLGRYREYKCGAAQNRGEAHVAELLARYCENKHAHVLNHLTLPLEDGSTTQIDHVLVCSKGIFVIETKHYNGWIFAKSKSKAWMQSFYYDKFRFQNPIHQNYKHVKAIEKILDFLEPKFIYNKVVFSGRAVFKTIKPDNVYYIEELIPAIEQYPDGILSLNRIQFCVGRLEYIRLELTQKTDFEHHRKLVKKSILK